MLRNKFLWNAANTLSTSAPTVSRVLAARLACLTTSSATPVVARLHCSACGALLASDQTRVRVKPCVSASVRKRRARRSQTNTQARDGLAAVQAQDSDSMGTAMQSGCSKTRHRSQKGRRFRKASRLVRTCAQCGASNVLDDVCVRRARAATTQVPSVSGSTAIEQPVVSSLQPNGVTTLTPSNESQRKGKKRKKKRSSLTTLMGPTSEARTPGNASKPNDLSTSFLFQPL